MKQSVIVLSLFSLLFFSQHLIAGEGHNHGHGSKHDSMMNSSGSSMHDMAKIMMHLNHFPSSSEKKVLQKIAESSNSMHEKTIATAMINLQHSASSADKRKLKAIMNDASASADVKALAEIVHNLSHKPSRGDKQRLQAMID